MTLSDEQRLDWLQLIRSENVGPRTFFGLVNRFGGARAALEALPDIIARHAGGRRIKIASRQDCLREIEAAGRLGARFIALGEPDFPASLRAIDSPPPLLCVHGQADALRRPMVAIVGSRNASAAGLAFAERLARELAGADFVIASGLARGIDQRAHRACLSTGTVAALAGGIDRVYPPEHVGLAQEIAARGAVITEMPVGWEPRGRDFPRRNRIVSGLALAVIVVEAARRSGSLITARFANEQGREVFAVPGSPLDPRAEGANDLLKQGASLCLCAGDVIEALAPLLTGAALSDASMQEEGRASIMTESLWEETDLFGDPAAPVADAAFEFDDEGAALVEGEAFQTGGGATKDAASVVLALLGAAPVTVDDLVRAADAPVSDVQAALLDLELAGKLIRHGGNRVSRA